MQNGTPTNAKKYTALKRIISTYFMGKGNTLTLSALCMAVVAICTSLNAWLVQPVLDDIFVKQERSMLIILPCLVLLNALVKSIATFYQNVLMKIVGQNAVCDMQMDLYQSVIYNDVALLNKYTSGGLISRFTNDINIIRNIIYEMINCVISSSITLIGLICIMLYQSISLTIIILCVFPILAYPLTILGRIVRSTTDIMQETFGEFTQHVHETLSNIELIKSFCTEEKEVIKNKSIVHGMMKSFRKIAYVQAAILPAMEIVGGIAVAIVICYGGYEVVNGDLTTGSFFSFLLALLMLYKPVTSFSHLYSQIQEITAASNRFFEVIDCTPIIKDGGITREDEPFTHYDIVVKNLFFTYQRDGERPVLNNFNMEVKQGQSVALIGESGAGKSTVFHLLQRFDDPSDGIISIGQHNIKDLNLTSLRKTMSLVTQNILLFNSTIKENIAYGSDNTSDEQIIKAAKVADIHNFIMSLPDQYNTNTGDRAITLSGGQKQRIAIARAVLSNAPILLLDEATSALDSNTEDCVQKAINNLKNEKGITTITIAHRLSSIISADTIYFMDKGRVVDSGSHRELLERCKRYRSYYNKYKEDVS